MRFACWVAIAATLAATAGCGEAKPKLVAVRGKVVFDGKPLSAGSLTFHPEGGTVEKGDRPSCQLQADGSFTAQTFPYGDGMLPGAYKVTLDSGLAGRIKKPDYADPQKTPWKVTVTEGGLADQVLEVK